jgi:dethiobiotin synthetase
VHLPQSITTPFLLKEPAAPHIAAALEGITISPVPILAPTWKSTPHRMRWWWKAWAASACR